jgi:hypothetical protein
MTAAKTQTGAEVPRLSFEAFLRTVPKSGCAGNEIERIPLRPRDIEL